MYQAVLNRVPDNWVSPQSQELVSLSTFSSEYRQLKQIFELTGNSNLNFTIQRVQNVHHYGQFLLRAQLMVNNGNQTYYKVRRFIKIEKKYKNDAITYNLDTRRCGQGSTSLRFSQTPPDFGANEVLFIVQVIVDNLNNSVQPSNTLEYYIEYVVEKGC